MRPPSTTNANLIRILADLFKATDVGEVVTYEHMCSVTELRLPDFRHLIGPAKRLANSEVGALYRSVRKVGYVRHRSGEAHAHLDDGMRKMRRVGHRVTRFAMNAITRSNDVTNDEVLKAHAKMTQVGLAINILGGRSPVAADDAAKTAKAPSPADTARASVFALMEAKNKRLGGAGAR